jgi:hypothetical protein
MIHVQLRRYLPDATTRAEVLDVEEIQFSKAGSATAALTLKVSLAMSEGIRDWIEDHPGQAFIVGVEYSVDGGQWITPRDNLFVAYKGTADDADPAEVQQITCMDWVSWQLARTYLHWAAGAVNNEREWTESGFPASAGTIIGGMIYESKNRGWGPAFQTDFAWNVDSAGAAWTAAEKVKQKWKLLTPLTQVLQSITEQGLCDWWSEGTKLRLFRPGVGEDRTNVVLGGADFTRAPGAWDFSNVLTNLTVVPEDADMWLYLPNPGADTTFGRLEATMTQSGVADHATATTLAQPTLAAGKAAKREQSYEWTVSDGMPVPWVDFNVHDIVTIDTAFGTREERVVELVVRVRNDVVTCVAVTGDKLLSAVARRDRRAQSAVIGNVVGGSGNGIPGSSGPTVAGPVAPTGLHVESNIGSWRADGTAQAAVTIEWDAVSQTVDGSDVAIRGYEVASRTGNSDPVIVSVSGTSLTTTEWEPGVVRYVKVRAVTMAGVTSEWSAEIAVTPQMPGLIIPKVPTGLAPTSNTAAFQSDGSALATITVGWSAVTQSIDNSPLMVKEYEVKVGLDTQRVTGTTVTFTVPSGRGVAVTVRALSTLDVWGDPTAALSITGAAPTTTMPAPSAPSLTAGMGAVAFRWDGLSSTGAAMPAGFNRVLVDVGSSATGPWSPLGTPLSASGGGTVTATPGAAVFIRFRSFDTLGRVGGTSTVVSATATGVSLDDIDPDLSGELDEIRLTADGKNRIYTSATEPGSIGGVLRRNYVPNPDFVGWSGWSVQTQNVTVSPGGIVDIAATAPSGALLPYQSAAAPTSAGDVWSHALEVSVPAGYPPVSMTVSTVPYLSTGASTGPITHSPEVTIQPGETVRLDVTAPAALAAHTGYRLIPYLRGAPVAGRRVVFRHALQEKGNARGSFISGSTPAAPGKGYRWVGVANASVSEEVGSAFTPGDQWWELDATKTSIVGVKVWNGLDWVDYLIVADQIVVAGSITSPLFQAGSVQVDHLAPNVGQSIDISANASVNIIVGRQDEQAGQIETLGGDVEAAQSSADTAHSAASGAQASADAVGARLDHHQLYFKVEVDSVKIGRPDGSSELRLAPEGIQMMQQGVPVSRWEGGVFIADETRLKASSIASHRFEGFGPGRTIIRPL